MPTLKILMRNQKSENWKLVESAAYGAEAELQNLLAGSPSLIPVDEIREGVSPLVVAVREFGLAGSGNTDLLAFSADGDIPADFSKWHSITIDEAFLKQANALEQFKAAVVALGNRVHLEERGN
jgi:hypothetical protein